MLVVGMRGLGAEVSKNIVLAGVREIVVMDHTSLERGDTAERFLMQHNGVNVLCPTLILLTSGNTYISLT